MELSQFASAVELAATDILVWIGFGTLVGLLAKIIMPGRSVAPTIATLAVGLGGTVIGCGVVMWISGGHRVSPISLPGLLAATGGGVMLMFFYRLLTSRMFDTRRRTVVYTEPAPATRRRAATRRRRTARPVEVVYDDTPRGSAGR